MRSCLLILTILILSMQSVYTQEVIKLPKPSRDGGKALMSCLNERKSSRNFTDRDIPMQEISNLLWAANGINREDIGKHTAPTAMNWQNMELYVVLPQGIFFYNDISNELQLILEGNYNNKTGTQDFVADTRMNIIIVSDMAKLGEGPIEKKNLYAGIHAGAIMQNIYLYCASAGLKTVTRASFDQSILSELLKLSVDKKVILCQSVGY